MFDFLNFLKLHGIDYVESGANVKKGNVNIDCPFCNLPASHHSSHHLGIDLSTSYWGCWRNKSHRGKRPHRLIMKLIGCSFIEAKKIVGDTSNLIEDNAFELLASGSYFSTEKGESDVTHFLRFPDSFRRFDGRYAVEQPFLTYLEKQRGFGKDALKVCDRYGLRYCVVGRDWKNRLIIPLTHRGLLVSWIGRAIFPDKLRYRNLEVSECVIDPKKFIYNFDNAMKGGKVLFVVEGPGDVWKMDFYLYRYNASSVGLLNMNCEEPQLYWLSVLCSKYEKVVLLLDEGELVGSSTLALSLDFIDNLQVAQCPVGTKDPGNLTRRQVFTLAERYF